MLTPGLSASDTAHCYPWQARAQTPLAPRAPEVETVTGPQGVGREPESRAAVVRGAARGAGAAVRVLVLSRALR